VTTKLAADFLAHRVFTFEEAKARYGLQDHAARQAIFYAKRRGQIGAVRKGLYFVVPPGADPATYRPDPYLVAAKAEPAGALAYHAALDLHGVANSAFHEVAVAAPRWRRGFAVGDVAIRFVQAPMNFGTQSVAREGVSVAVTDRERTVVDGCDRPAYVGGIEELLRSVDGFPSVDHGRILDYVRRYRRGSLAAKVGWALDRLAEQWGFPDEVRDGLQALRPRGVVTLESASSKRLDSAWGVLLPAALEARLQEEYGDRNPLIMGKCRTFVVSRSASRTILVAAIR
jgi:predicted transcriptional regulator of viral defense system